MAWLSFGPLASASSLAHNACARVLGRRGRKMFVLEAREGGDVPSDAGVSRHECLPTCWEEE